MFRDEARFGRINDLRRCRAPKPLRPVCRAMLAHEHTCACAALDIASGELDSLILPNVNTACIQAFLEKVAGGHAGGALRVPANLRRLPQPPHAPELKTRPGTPGTNRARSASTTWPSTAWRPLEDPLEASLRALEQDPEKIKSMVAWPRIMNALLNEKRNESPHLGDWGCTCDLTFRKELSPSLGRAIPIAGGAHPNLHPDAETPIFPPK